MSGYSCLNSFGRISKKGMCVSFIDRQSFLRLLLTEEKRDYGFMYCFPRWPSGLFWEGFIVRPWRISFLHESFIWRPVSCSVIVFLRFTLQCALFGQRCSSLHHQRNETDSRWLYNCRMQLSEKCLRSGSVQMNTAMMESSHIFQLWVIDPRLLITINPTINIYTTCFKLTNVFAIFHLSSSRAGTIWIRRQAPCRVNMFK